MRLIAADDVSWVLVSLRVVLPGRVMGGSPLGSVWAALGGARVVWGVLRGAAASYRLGLGLGLIWHSVRM